MRRIHAGMWMNEEIREMVSQHCRREEGEEDGCMREKERGEEREKRREKRDEEEGIFCV